MKNNMKIKFKSVSNNVTLPLNALLPPSSNKNLPSVKRTY